MKFQKTYFAKKSTIIKKWLLIDAKNEILGRLASQIAKVLMGKNKLNYTPNMDCGDNIVVINAQKIKFTGKKILKKLYYKHTGYPGGLKQKTALEIINSSFSEKILRFAVTGMMPKESFLARKQLKNLYIYPQTNHNHMGQNPTLVKITKKIKIKKR